MTNPNELAWIPVPSSSPKEVIDNLYKLADLKVMKQEARASNTVDNDPEIKKMMSDEYTKDGVVRKWKT
jgi:hypothetical protein